MDCCNYMSYRQSYYGGVGGSPYYDHLSYHGDFYGHPYHEYGYGASPYYPHPWQCAAPFPDYVYNPKEARIRKAMREASRERSLGATPMTPARNSARRQTNWMPNPEEQLMMTPSQALRGHLNSPLCGTPDFPVSSESTPFMSMNNSYNKAAHHMPHGPLHPTNPYMQQMPLTALQHETSMWSSYGDVVPERPADGYLMPDLRTYRQPEDISRTSRTPDKKLKLESDGPCSKKNYSRRNENHEQKMMGNDQQQYDQDGPMMENGQIRPTEEYIPVYSENTLTQNSYSTEDAKIKKPPEAFHKHKTINNIPKPSSKPLPDFNEAFGSTERGRFQSPPDPRLAPNKNYLDYFFNNSPVKYEDYQI